MKVDIIKKAAAFSRDQHKYQKRKTGEPYFVHPKAVAGIVSKWSKDVNVIAAAYLHDVIEDTNCDYEDIQDRFGDKVARYVALSSRDFRLKKDLSLKLFRASIAKAPPEVKLIIAADLYHNANSPADRDFMKHWFRKTRETIPYVRRGNLGRYKGGILRLLEGVETAIEEF